MTLMVWPKKTLILAGGILAIFGLGFVGWRWYETSPAVLARSYDASLSDLQSQVASLQAAFTSTDSARLAQAYSRPLSAMQRDCRKLQALGQTSVHPLPPRERGQAKSTGPICRDLLPLVDYSSSVVSAVTPFTQIDPRNTGQRAATANRSLDLLAPINPAAGDQGLAEMISILKKEASGTEAAGNHPAILVLSYQAEFWRNTVGIADLQTAISGLKNQVESAQVGPKHNSANVIQPRAQTSQSASGVE